MNNYQYLYVYIPIPILKIIVGKYNTTERNKVKRGYKGQEINLFTFARWIDKLQNPENILLYVTDKLYRRFIKLYNYAERDRISKVYEYRKDKSHIETHINEAHVAKYEDFIYRGEPVYSIEQYRLIEEKRVQQLQQYSRIVINPNYQVVKDSNQSQIVN